MLVGRGFHSRPSERLTNCLARTAGDPLLCCSRIRWSEQFGSLLVATPLLSALKWNSLWVLWEEDIFCDIFELPNYSEMFEWIWDIDVCYYTIWVVLFNYSLLFVIHLQTLLRAIKFWRHFNILCSQRWIWGKATDEKLVDITAVEKICGQIQHAT